MAGDVSLLRVLSSLVAGVVGTLTGTLQGDFGRPLAPSDFD